MTSATRSAQGQCTLEGRYFHCPRIYRREGQRVFRRHWICVGRTSEISRAGDYLSCQVEQEDLIVVRVDQDTVRAYYNVCRHRGTQLCQEPTGRFHKSIVCPYHAWTYALDGRLISAPNMRDVDGFESSDYGLHEVACQVWNGFVLINLLPNPAPVSELLSQVERQFAAWRLADLQLVHRLTYEVEANWKVLFHNYNECYHCPKVHPALNRISSSKSATNLWTDGMILGGPMRLADGIDSMTMDGRPCGQVFSDLTPQQRCEVYYVTIFPTLFLSPHPDFVLTHRIERLSPQRTRIVCDFLFAPESVERAGFDADRAVQFWDLTNRQDWHVCQLTQTGTRSAAYSPGPYSNLESVLAAFDRYYLQQMG